MPDTKVDFVGPNQAIEVVAGYAVHAKLEQTRCVLPHRMITQSIPAGYIKPRVGRGRCEPGKLCREGAAYRVSLRLQIRDYHTHGCVGISRQLRPRPLCCSSDFVSEVIKTDALAAAMHRHWPVTGDLIAGAAESVEPGQISRG